MAIKRKNEVKNKNVETNLEIIKRDATILESEAAVPSSNKLHDSVLENISIEREDNNSYFNESVRVFDY